MPNNEDSNESGDDSSKISWAPFDVSDDEDHEDENHVSSISSSSPPHSSDCKALASVPSKPTPKVKTDVTAMSTTQGTKCKSIHEHVQEIAMQDCTQRLKLIEVKQQEKTNHAQVKSQAKNTLEMARMEYQWREAERQCQHELSMLDRQIELKQLRRGGQLPHLPFGFPGGPTFHAPLSHNAINPTL